MCILSKRESDKDTYWESLKKAVKEGFGIKPTDFNAQNAERTFFYKDLLLNKVKALFEIECPETWDKDYLLDKLILTGKVCVTDTSMGVIALGCSPYGVNVYSRHTDVMITNPVLGSFDRKIKINCELIYLYDNKRYRSLTPLIDVYAAKLAQVDSSIDTNLINTKLAWLFDVSDDKQSKEAKMIYDKISRGEPAVFYRSNTGIDSSNKLNFFTTHVKEQYIVDKLQEEKQTIINEFLNEIGINNANFEKKERLLVDEVNANNDEISLNMKYARDNVKECVERVNKMFPDLHLKIDIPLYDKEQARDKGDRKNEPDRTGADMGVKE